MQTDGYSDSDIEKITIEITNFEANPSNWGEPKWWNSEVDLLAIWEWAEARNRIDIMSTIASPVVARIITNRRLDLRNENYKDWLAKLERLSNQAKADNQIEFHVSFLEAIWDLIPWQKRNLERLDDILALYRQLGKPEKIVYYLGLRAKKLNSLITTRQKDLGEDEIWKSYIEAYKASREIHFKKRDCTRIGRIRELSRPQT